MGEVGVVTRLTWQTAAGDRDMGTPLRLDIPSEMERGAGGREGFGGPGGGGLFRNTPLCQH